MSKEESKYEVVVWDLSYALKDEDGDYKHDAIGNVEVYDHPNEDKHLLAEYLKPEDLEKRDSTVNCYSCDGLVYLSECIPADNNVGGCICTRCVDTWSTGNKERKTK